MVRKAKAIHEIKHDPTYSVDSITTEPVLFALPHIYTKWMDNTQLYKFLQGNNLQKLSV